MKQCKIITGTKQNCEKQINKVLHDIQTRDITSVTQSISDKGVIVITLIFEI